MSTCTVQLSVWPSTWGQIEWSEDQPICPPSDTLTDSCTVPLKGCFRVGLRIRVRCLWERRLNRMISCCLKLISRWHCCFLNCWKKPLILSYGISEIYFLFITVRNSTVMQCKVLYVKILKWKCLVCVYVKRSKCFIIFYMFFIWKTKKWIG